MQSEIEYDILETFIEELKSAGIKKVVFAETREKRAQQIDDTQVGVVRVSEVVILGYKDSVIYKCSQSDADFDSIYDQFIAEGFEVKKTSRNIT